MLRDVGRRLKLAYIADPCADLATACRAFGRGAPPLAVSAHRHAPRDLVRAMRDGGVQVLLIYPVRVGGPDALERLATRDDVDFVVVGTGGVVSLRPVLAALRAGKIVATANKETLVAGGHLVMPLARERAAAQAAIRPGDPYASPLAWLRPIDSEHSAIWQSLVGESMASVAALILTASGGPFLDADAATLAAVTPAQALRHPTWTMGAKITIDSATLANKGLEVIEAHWLYDVGYDAIEVVIHPQSVVHSAVRFVDGSLKAQLGTPDMRLPIQYALTYPDRRPSPATDRFTCGAASRRSTLRSPGAKRSFRVVGAQNAAPLSRGQLPMVWCGRVKR
jgi:1-deoxy-D-xylulose-5-phosphate reductoisomerase